MSGKRRALVIGGSMSGLLAGITLSRRGWDP
jgi:2-polyprenyl-6-methoxyphenol hydroxylase-like FAD-dependent oxidoreductase